jgi:hypothetical protein
MMDIRQEITAFYDWVEAHVEQQVSRERQAPLRAAMRHRAPLCAITRIDYFYWCNSEIQMCVQAGMSRWLREPRARRSRRRRRRRARSCRRAARAGRGRAPRRAARCARVRRCRPLAHS